MGAVYLPPKWIIMGAMYHFANAPLSQLTIVAGEKNYHLGSH